MISFFITFLFVYLLTYEKVTPITTKCFIHWQSITTYIKHMVCTRYYPVCFPCIDSFSLVKNSVMETLIISLLQTRTQAKRDYVTSLRPQNKKQRQKLSSLALGPVLKSRCLRIDKVLFSAIWPSNPTSGHTHQGNQIWKRHVHSNVHRSPVNQPGHGSNLDAHQETNG